MGKHPTYTMADVVRMAQVTVRRSAGTSPSGAYASLLPHSTDGFARARKYCAFSGQQPELPPRRPRGQTSCVAFL